jgi:hypothetical protein
VQTIAPLLQNYSTALENNVALFFVPLQQHNLKTSQHDEETFFAYSMYAGNAVPVSSGMACPI